MSTLAEDLFLLADDRVTGRPVIDHIHLDLGLGGALLFDLLLCKRVALVDLRVNGIDRTATGDQLLDDALTTITGEIRTREPDYWVRRLSRNAYHQVRGRLVASGALRLDDHKVFGLIPMHQTPQADRSVERGLRDSLYGAVVLGRPASPQTAALASLVLAVGLQRHLFPGWDQQSNQDRRVELANGQWVVDAVVHTINATNAALGIVPFDDTTDSG